MFWKHSLMEVVLLCIIITHTVLADGVKNNIVEFKDRNPIIKDIKSEAGVYNSDESHRVNDEIKTSTVVATQQNINKINDILKRQEISATSVNGQSRKVIENGIEVDCDPPEASIKEDKVIQNKEKVKIPAEVHDRPKPIVKKVVQNPHDDVLFEADNPIIQVGEQKRRPQTQHVRIKHINGDSGEDVEGYDTEEDESVPSNRREQSLKDLIRKLRKAGVSWRVIYRELSGDDYLDDDYVRFRPSFHRLRYSPRHRIRYERYPYYRPYDVEEYSSYIPEIVSRIQAERPIRPVYSDDELKKKK